MIGVSKCLLGENCRYDGKNMRCEEVLEYIKDQPYIGICPECLGNLPIPRLPSEIKDGRVISKDGRDVDDAFRKGAQLALEILKNHHCDEVILQERSPSCGLHEVYDGTFSNRLVEGKGICAQLLEKNGIRCRSSEEIKEEMKKIGL